MLLKLTFILFIYLTSLLADRLFIYDNARFDVGDVQYRLIDTYSVNTQNACICQCVIHSWCITINYIGINQTCILFNASLAQGEIRIMLNSSSSVITFPNRIHIIPNPPAIIEWLFDRNFKDVYGLYNGQLTENNIDSYISPGYAGHGSAVYFPYNNYSLVDHYLHLTATDFTISAWIWIPYNITNVRQFFTLFGHCQTTSQDRCLHIAVLNGKLYFGLYNDDLTGSTQMNSNQWYHIAYVYDRSTSKQIVYLNGNLDRNRTAEGFYMGNASQISLGSVPQFTWENYVNGYMDKLIFVSYIKNYEQLLDEATLVAYYKFDNTSYDSGLNQINNVTDMNTTFAATDRFNYSLVINSTYSSYFETSGFYFLGQTNYSYSFALWIYPFITDGTILQVTSPSGWCVPMIGFSKHSKLTIQTLSSNGIYATSFVNETLPLESWTHVTMTYSTEHGIQLFVNGSLVSSNNNSNDYMASGEYCTIIIGTYLQPDRCAMNETEIFSDQFEGMIDELRIYSRKLSPMDIVELATF